MDLKESALAYARRGWPIFPCQHNKKPYEGTNGVLDSTTDPVKIEELWTTYPRANIGLDVGGAGMVVLDLDPGHDWDEVVEALGEVDTKLVQDTPRGGEHLFFKLRRGEIIPPSVSAIARHVDIRSYHSYVLLAPSKTKDGYYKWQEEGPAVDRPDTLIEACKKIATEQSIDHDTWIIEPDLEENVAAAVVYLSKEAQIGVVGLDGDMMTYRTAAMMKSYGVSMEGAFDLMWKHWCPRCEPPWDESGIENLETKIGNAYRYNTSPPGNVTEAYKVAKHQALFKPVVSCDTKGGKSSEVGRFRFVDERGVEAIKPPEWLIRGVLPQRSYGMLIGPRAAYKTFLALDIAMSIASGGRSWYESGEWLGPWPDVVTSGPVLYAAGEGRAGIKSRVEAWRDYHIDGDYTEQFHLVDPVPYPTEEDVTAFIEGALALQDSYELVVLDTVGRAMQGLNENSQQDASLLTKMVQTIQTELNCAVLALHHTGHSASDRARGSSVFGADVDSEFVVERYEKEYVRVKNTKQKDAAEWEEAALVHIKPHLDSLVATKAKEAKAVKAVEEDKARVKGGGRKTKVELEIELSTVRKAAYQQMKVYPNKEWSKRALADAISAHEAVNVASGTIRNKYLEHLLTDKAHPVARCYDIGRGTWRFKK